MGEVAALRQLVGQVQELWDLYGANAHHPLPRQAPHLPPRARTDLFRAAFHLLAASSRVNSRPGLC
jgi:hypothetical protein